jgi:hypothetical protein
MEKVLFCILVAGAACSALAQPKGDCGEALKPTQIVKSTHTENNLAFLSVFDSDLVLLCHKRSLAFKRRQHGHRGSVLSKAAAIRSRKVVMDDGTWRCVRWAAARLVMRG